MLQPHKQTNKHTHKQLYLYNIRTIDHAICAFNLPTQYNAPGQEGIIDEKDKVRLKVDPTKLSLDDITTTQMEEIVDSWMKFITKIFRDAAEKVGY